MENQQYSQNEIIIPKKKRRIWLWFLVVAVLIFGAIGVFFYKASYTFSQISVKNPSAGGILPLADNIPLPVQDPDRINILLLGYGGEGHDGPYLTDSILLVSIQKSTGRVGLISIPRDLYVTMPGETYKEKINNAYSLGLEKKGVAGALFLSKTAVSRATGLYIDHTVSVDHEAFKQIVDIIGGVDVKLNKPFIEDQQWVRGGDYGPSFAINIKTYTATSSSSTVATITQKYVFELPSGVSHLDGITALYFVRARYATNDFDRMGRLQQTLLAVKDKVLTLGILGNPVRLLQIMDSLGQNIKTDMTTGEMTDLLAMYPKLDTKNYVRKVLDISPNGLLYASKAIDGAYILLPIGDNFDKIQEMCKNIFQ